MVFTDLVGSTEMSNRLGPEATEALRVIHFGLLRGAMEAHGGIEVKNLGDGLMIVFPSLGAALDGSVAMQQAIERHNTSGKEALGIRVGISTGDATEEDGDYFGEPVVEAARLCAKCDAGQIITSELISVMAKRSGHAFESIGDLDLRGVPEPVASVSVLWEPLQIAGEVPMPDRLRPDMEQRIAGRARESDALDQAFKSAEAAQRRLTLLAGEPGIGKTRLASELASYAHGRGAVVLYGRCDEELSLPYQPWVEAIGHLLESSDSEAVKTALDLHGPELATLVPQLRRRFPDLAASTSTDAETERYMLLQAVTGCLSLLGADTPVLLVLDDLHWADKQTLTMLRHVLTNMAAASLMIVVTYRDSDLGSGHPLTDTVAALRRETGVELINVMGLDDLEMVQLVEISAGHELDDDARNMALMLRQETAGNPFFAHEILRNLVEHGDLYIDEATGRWAVAKTFEELSLPQSVRDVVGQRIARLGDEPLKTLSTAAIIGREFDLDLLADVTGIDEDDLLDQLDLATAAGVLVEVPGSVERFRFPHTLARSTLAADLSEGRRRRIHRKVAESLEASIGDAPGGRAGELATHWLAAAVSVDVAKATRYARLAGQHAQAALAPDEAIRWFTAALENLELADEPDDLERARLLVDLGMAQKDASEPAYRQTLLDAGALAEQIGDSSLMATAAIANSRGFTSKLGIADKERIDALERALTAIGAGATAERAMLLATLISELEYHSTFEDRMARYDEAISIARDVGDPATLAFVLNRLCVSLAVPQTLELRRDASVEACALADELGDVTLRFWSQCGAYTYAVGSGDPDAADAELEELTETARASGRASLRWIAGYLRGSLLSFWGDADRDRATCWRELCARHGGRGTGCTRLLRCRTVEHTLVPGAGP